MRGWTLLTCIATVFVMSPVVAQAAQPVNIVLANKVVGRIYTGGQYSSVSAREGKISQRFVQAISYEECVNPQLSMVMVNGRWTISVGSTMLMQVYPEDARGAGVDPKTLATQWKNRLAYLLPRAVSPIRGGIDDPTIVLPDEPKPSGLGPEDEPLVTRIVGIFDRARKLSDEEYTLTTGGLQASILSMIWGYRKGSDCPPPPVSHDTSVKNVLKLVRLVDEHRYHIERLMYAGKTIQRVRKKYHIIPGTGPVGPVQAYPTPLPPPQISAGTPIAKAMLGTGLDANNKLVNPGQRFPANTAQIMLYLEIKGAPNNTIVGVSFHLGEEVVGRSRIRVSGDRPFAVNFYPQTADTFTPGDYECRLSVNDQPAGVIPFRVVSPQ